LREGLRELCFRGPESVAVKLADIARQYGAELHRSRPEALDLFDVEEPTRACSVWLGPH
jgi:hypothetical protein